MSGSASWSADALLLLSLPRSGDVLVRRRGATLGGMWFLILIVVVGACVLAYKNRVTLLARILGQSEARIDRQLKRRGH